MNNLATKLSPLVWCVMGANPGPMTLTGSCTYLIGAGAERILIDTAQGRPAYIDALKTTLRETQARVAHVVLTHWHGDHVGGLAAVLNEYPSAKVWKSPSIYDHVSMPKGIQATPLPPNDVIRVEGATIRVVATPGHTDDHVCPWLEEERAFFTGDTILGSSSTVVVCLRDYLKSLQTLRGFQPLKLYPGHGPVMDNAVKIIDEYVEHRTKRGAAVLAALRQADAEISTSGVRKLVYTDIHESLIPAATLNTVMHLLHLREEGHCSAAQGGELVAAATRHSSYELLAGEVAVDSSTEVVQAFRKEVPNVTWKVTRSPL